MYRIVKKEALKPTVTLYEIEAPMVAKKAEPGQFIILRVDENGERIPITIHDFDREKGTVTIIVQTIGATTEKLRHKAEGEYIQDFVGPLGRPTETEGKKKVCVVGGGVGCAIAYPVLKKFHDCGAEVHAVVGFKNKDLVILEDKFRAASSVLKLMTDDGTYGEKGLVTDALKQLIEDIRHVIDLPGDGERSIRCDCNISVGVERCEVKNVTGLKNVERALTFEVVRQTKILRAGGKIDRETRRFDEERGVTISVRKKEFEADYGYIDEPDLGIYHIKELADSIKIKESPQKMALRMSSQYGIEQRMAKQLIATSMGLAEMFERIAGEFDSAAAVKWVAGPISANWKAMESAGRNAEDVIGIIRRFVSGEITDSECTMEIKCAMTGEDAESAGKAAGDLEEMINGFIDQNPGVVADYQKNDKAANKIIGQVMKATSGAYSSAEVVEAVKRLIEARF